MALRPIKSWDGDIEAVGVEDTDGGVWWPDEATQEEIQQSNDPEGTAIRICRESPMRGEWHT